MAVTAACSPYADDALGPIVHGCRGNFDFTVTFEQCFFAIAPAAAMLLFGSGRLYVLQFRREKHIKNNFFRWTKVAAIAVLSALQLALVVLWATTTALPARSYGIAAAVLSFSTSLLMAQLSPLEHTRSLRPSSVLGAYLFFTMLFDGVILRTVWLSPSFSPKVRAVATSAYCLKGAVLLLEAKEKRQYLVASKDKSHSPEDFSGPYAQSLFWWLNGLIRSGFRNVLKPIDLFPIQQGLRADLLSQRFRSMWHASPNQGKNTLLLTIIRVFGTRLLLPVIPRLALLAFSFCQPLLIRSFLQYLNDGQPDVRVGYGYIGAYGIVYIGIAIASSIYWQAVYRSLTMLRGMLIAAIYEKAMSIDTAARGSNAKEVTLMGTDVERIIRGVLNMHELWANTVQIALATWLLKTELGVACVGPVAITLCLSIENSGLTTANISAVSLGATIYSATFTAKRQLGWMEAIEKRISTTSSFLASMKSVKMTGIAPKVYRIVENLRVDEIKAARAVWILAVYASTIALVPELMSPVATFGIFTADAVSKDATLDTTRLFTSLSLLILLTQPLFSLFESVSLFASALGCFARIEEYLLKNQWQDMRILISAAGKSSDANKPDRTPNADALCIADGIFAWSTAAEFSVSGISCKLKKSQQLFIVGPVASGKSTLLRAILGELPITSGEVRIFDKSIAYCDQTPWISNGTIQDNIVGQSRLDLDHYRLTLKACSLEPDLKELQHGDQTRVGSKGIALSSGQKHRIALARAVYSRKRIMLFDGIFSQLDTNVQATIFANLFGPGGLFRQWGTTVVLTTHEVQFLPFADQIICLNGTGQQCEQGHFEQLRSSGGYVDGLVRSGKIDMTVSLPRPDLRVEEPGSRMGTAPGEKGEQKSEGSQDKSRQLGDWSTYRFYFASLGWWIGLVFVVLQISCGFFNVFPIVWLERWAHANTEHPSHQEDSRFLGGYVGFQVAAMLSAAALTWFSFLVMARKAGLHLHTQMLKSVIRAPMSLFQKSDSGSILTRFSQDFNFIDSRLPLAVMCVVTNLFTCLGEAGLVASASAWVVISYPLLIAAVYFIQQYYLRTSRQLRFLDLEEKAPLYTQFLETLEGLSTVRAFGWQQAYMQHNHVLVDNAQKPFYLLYMIQKWLALVLDLMIAALAVLVVGIIVALRHDVSVGFSGVSLTQIMSLTGYIKLLIMFWTSMETSLGAVHRVKQFVNDTTNEREMGEQSRAPESWPTKGEIVLNDVCAVYRGEKSDHTALHNVTMHIKPGEKIAICGRTGSGKTSLMLSLFSMIELSNGSISIDGIDLSTLQKDDLRARLNGVPDDPFFFPGSVRANLDIEGDATDEQSRQALVRFGLDEALLGAQGGLDAELKPEELSQGQKQKFALARAMLRPCGKVVVLDEATSKTDRDTDAAMHLAISEVFADCTMIAIVHRLSNILDWDRIAVLDQGRLVEFDSPRRLLAQEGSVFKRLYEGHKEEGDL